ncbi:MAG: Shikimate dehydrogenase [Bacteroidetes bacterium]|nr:Shikimate dehydrogenase [Bacteroidota bacterium]
MKKTYGLIGYPLGHSFSQKYFTEKFEKENISGCEFNLYPISTIDELPSLISSDQSIKGLSVTIPYKESVIPFLDELDETAKKIGAVNCIKVSRDEYQVARLTGYNTDAFGFRQSIKPFLETQHERALILGTGGASKAVAYVLKEIGLDCYFVTRNKKNSKIQSPNIFEYSELNEYIFNAFKLIVNTTPLGTFPDINSAPEIPYQYLSPSHLLYDLVYNPAETEFLKRGKLQGAATVNGLSMLQQQAEEAWRIWGYE